MNPTDTISIPSQVMARQLGEETVILDLSSGSYFSLDDVGARAWELLTEGKDFDAIAQHMLSEYEVGLEALTQDLTDLFAALGKEGLVSFASNP